MVGVPGRSRSCVTCLGRKKGCDRNRPSCTQCIKAGLICGGYDRATVFVNSTQAAGRSPTPYRRQNAATSLAPGQTSLALSAQEITLPFGLTQTAYNLRYIDRFWSAYLPNGKAFTNAAARLSNGGWVNIALDLYPADRSLQLAMQGVVLRGLGARDENKALVGQGSAAYLKCLQEFHKALNESKRLKHDALLCTAKLLSLFEMHYGADEMEYLVQQRSWVAHARAQLAILTARQPQEFRSGKAHQLFVDYRYILIISAIFGRRRFVLTDNGWNTTPWKSIRKSPRDKLLDILGDLAGILEDIDNRDICENLEERAALKQSITRSCWGLSERLQSWANEVGSLKDFRTSTSSDDVAGPRDSEDFALAHLTILYWATCALVYANLLALVDLGTATVPQLDPLEYARKVVYALPFFLDPSAGIMGSKSASFPLGLVLQVLYGTENKPSEHRDLLAEFFKSQGETKAIAKFVTSLQRGYATAETAERDGLQGIEARAKRWMNLAGS
ncbi:putative Zn(2)-C6 fungal-type domain-containing protein [Seiridium unicorne]|uniref:Zn(2)-C6 fungal-type domain-containing protein n=1 Tax=Seiridium unicorne TaxID=138068 RepID=A0ABR2V7M6_9PEZI